MLIDASDVAPLNAASEEFRHALISWLEADGASDYETDRLHYGSDLSPDKCERAIFYSLRGARRDPETLGSQLRFWGGRTFERAIGDALARTTKVIRQMLVKPLRPSAWCWSPGHVDLVLPEHEHFHEIKAPRAEAFGYAKSDPTRLVRESYRWQASAYFHELKRRGVARSGSFIFLDREGENEPIEVPLTGELLIPEEKIIAEEERKAYLVTAKTEPARIPRSVVARVWKGKPKQGRVLRVVAERHWSCGYCPFFGTCKPGNPEESVELSKDQVDYAIACAENRWAAGATTTPQVVRFGIGGGDYDIQRSDIPVSAPAAREERPEAVVSSTPTPASPRGERSATASTATKRGPFGRAAS
jgi:DNA-directed RNA polymerase subunit H (RpoH/RPB5)